MAKRAEPKKQQVRRLKQPIWLFVVAGVVVIIVGMMTWLEVAQAGKVAAGVRFGQESLGGLTVDEAAKKLRAQLATYEADGTKLQLNDKQLVMSYAVADPNGLGETTDAVTYDIDGTVASVTSYASGGSPLVGGWRRLRALLFGVVIQPKVSIDDDVLMDGLQNTLAKYEDPVVEPSYQLTSKGVTVEEPSAGNVFDYQAIAKTVEQHIRSASSDATTVSLQAKAASVTATEAETLLPAVRKIIGTGTITLHAGDQKITVKPSAYIEWLTPVRKDSALSITISDTEIRSYLTDLLPQVSTVAKNAKFQFKDGVVTQIQGSSKGRELDVDASSKTLAKALNQGNADIELTMHDVSPEATTDTVTNLGIRELVAVGKTNFAGSPPNRRHNIAVGANLLNGLLIKPGEEFSLIKVIGPVDATLGYLQELVIKGDHTIPEFGGGLCQIGTTMFRTVMNAGLPVLERQNHSYRVSYYEPPVGMDATIYEPKPDFRFKNDYNTYLLLQTRIEGNDLIFEFWGTKDTRTSSESTPKLSNIVPPPAPLTIESTDIPVGTTKCIEHAHNGSDAEFTYSVTKDGKKTDTLFKSHYKPWRQVCLLGVKKLSAGTPTKSSTNSNSNTNSTKNTNTSKTTNSNTNSSSL